MKITVNNKTYPLYEKMPEGYKVLHSMTAPAGTELIKKECSILDEGAFAYVITNKEWLDDSLIV